MLARPVIHGGDATATAPGPPVARAPAAVDGPVRWFDELRETRPVHWHAESASWYVTRFDDVWALLVDPRLGATSQDDFLRQLTPAQRAAADSVLSFVARWPVFLDPPQHTVERRLLLPAFAPKEIEGIYAAVRARASVLSATADPGSDLLAEVVTPACHEGLARLLGVAPGEFGELVAWSKQLIAFVGLSQFDADVCAAAVSALAAFCEFVEHTYERGRNVLAQRLRAAVDAGVITAADAVAAYAQVVTGALEPTVSAAAVAVEALAGNAVACEALAQEPNDFVAEAVRLATPFHFAPRRALDDLQIAGTTVPADARVVLTLVAANRDPRRFVDPLSIRLGRGLPPHVAFGRGRHACLGAALASQMLRAVLDGIGPERLVGLPPVHVDWAATLGMRRPVRLTVASPGAPHRISK
jgi:cytochrome P450